MLTFTTVLIGLILVLLRVLYGKTKRPSLLPPGPPTLSFFLEFEFGHQQFDVICDMKKKYGDVLSLMLGVKAVIVICGKDELHEVLVKNAEATSDRPDAFLFKDLFIQSGVSSSNGKAWKDIRTTTLKALRDFGVGKKGKEARILEEVEVFLKKIKETNKKPIDMKNLTNTCVCNVICSLTFGERHNHDDADFMKLTNSMHVLIAYPNSIGLLMFLPFLQYFPLDIFHAGEMKRISSEIREHCRKILEDHRRTFDSEERRDIADILIEKQNIYGRSNGSYSDDMVVQTLMDLLLGATETAVTTLRWFYLFMIRYPEIQSRMRKEIMDLIRPGKLITAQDRSNLHYCEAVVNETLRLGNIVPLSVPHLVSQDFMLDGYIIPKNAVLIPFLDSVNFDCNVFKDADRFDPMRFLNENGELSKTQKIMPFSTGRRSCIGESLARMELFLFTTNLIQSFELLPVTDTTEPSLDYNLGVTRAPKPYLIRAVPIEVEA